jgi:hypothetical protein
LRATTEGGDVDEITLTEDDIRTELGTSADDWVTADADADDATDTDADDADTDADADDPS